MSLGNENGRSSPVQLVQGDQPRKKLLFSTRPSRSAAPNEVNVTAMIVDKLFERQRVFADSAV